MIRLMGEDDVMSWGGGLSPSPCFSLQMDLDERNLVNTDNNTLFYLFLTCYNDIMLLPLVSRRLVQSQVRLKAIYP